MLYNIFNILSVDSVLPKYIPDCFTKEESKMRGENENCDLVIRNLESLPSPLIEVASNTYCNPYRKLVVYSSSFFGIHVSWSLKDLAGKRTEMGISRGYEAWSRLMRTPLGGVLSVEPYLKTILHVKLLQKGYAFVIAGCFVPVDRDVGVLVPAPNALGKTSIVTEAVKEHKAKFVADDTVIVDCSKNIVLSYPQPMRIRLCPRFDLLPFLERRISPEDIFNVTYSAKVDTLFFLEQAAEYSVEQISWEAATARLIATNRKILPYQYENTIIWYAGSNPSFRLDDLARREWYILSSFLKDKECFVMRFKGRPSHAVELMRKALRT